MTGKPYSQTLVTLPHWDCPNQTLILLHVESLRILSGNSTVSELPVVQDLVKVDLRQQTLTSVKGMSITHFSAVFQVKVTKCRLS